MCFDRWVSEWVSVAVQSRADECTNTESDELTQLGSTCLGGDDTPI